MANSNLILFGDSITQMSFSESGFGAYLSNIYARRLDVLNRGFSGYNTRWAKTYLTQIFPQNSQAKLVVVFFGANDASLVEHNPRQHVPVEEFGQNLIDICNHITSVCGPTTNILIVTPPPVYEKKRLIWQKERFKDQATGILERTNKGAGLYAAKCIEISKLSNYPVLDLWTLMQQQNDWPTLLSDGLHLTPKGNQFVGKAIGAVIRRAFPKLHVTPCKFTGSMHNSGSGSDLTPFLPWHDEIDEASYLEYRNVMEKLTAPTAPSLREGETKETLPIAEASSEK